VGAVDEAFREIEFPLDGEVLGERLEDLVEYPALNPTLIAAVHRLIRQILPRQLVPRCARLQDP
jgi:hypothetical protein